MNCLPGKKKKSGPCREVTVRVCSSLDSSLSSSLTSSQTSS